jgi:hypothetical protein
VPGASGAARPCVCAVGGLERGGGVPVGTASRSAPAWMRRRRPWPRRTRRRRAAPAWRRRRRSGCRCRVRTGWSCRVRSRRIRRPARNRRSTLLSQATRRHTRASRTVLGWKIAMSSCPSATDASGSAPARPAASRSWRTARSARVRGASGGRRPGT